MTIKAMIFDLDGTIADTLMAIALIMNELAPEFGYQPTNLEELPLIRHYSSLSVIRLLNISLFRLPFLIRKIKILLNKEISHIKPIQGMKESLIALKEQDIKLGILTSNNYDNVQKFLVANELELFDFIYCGATVFGKHHLLRKCLRKERLKRKEVLYVGDETRDIISAKKLPMRVVAVSWGFNSAEVLADHHPDFLIDHPRQLLELIKN